MTMRNILLVVLMFMILIPFATIQAQEAGIAKGLGLFVFPSNDQDKEKQDFDEFQ